MFVWSYTFRFNLTDILIKFLVISSCTFKYLEVCNIFEFVSNSMNHKSGQSYLVAASMKCQNVSHNVHNTLTKNSQIRSNTIASNCTHTHDRNSQSFRSRPTSFPWNSIIRMNTVSLARKINIVITWGVSAVSDRSTFPHPLEKNALVPRLDCFMRTLISLELHAKCRVRSCTVFTTHVLCGTGG